METKKEENKVAANINTHKADFKRTTTVLKH